VLRLIDGLCDAGAAGVVRPPCPHRGRVIALVKPIGGLRLCRSCVARVRAMPCSRCGAVRETAARDADGGPLCPGCLVAAVLARMLGIHITAAVAWQRASRGDWTSYAAGVSRRTGAGMTHQPETAGP
jgi:hypothetical protein